MAINENTGPKLEENQHHQPPATPTRCTLSQVSAAAPTTVLTPSSIFQRQNQQEKTNSPRDSILSSSDGGDDTNSPSDSIFSSSNRGNHTEVKNEEKGVE